MRIGLTLDTGALIAFERGSRRASGLLAGARQRGIRVTVPTPVVVEWWRGQRGPSAHLLDGIVTEPLSVALARMAGEALARHGHSASVVDAVGMASAAQRGDIVLTSDIGDLEALRAAFPAVRVLGV